MENRRMDDRRAIDMFEGCPKYLKHDLTEEQVIDIARRAVIMAKNEFNQDVGEAVTSRFFIVIGALVMGGLAWLTAHGYLK